MHKNFNFVFSDRAHLQFKSLEKDPSKSIILKAVGKTLLLMATNLRHPSLNTHEFYGRKGNSGEKIFESYAQNNTPGAYRIFWHYGPDRNQITIVDIVAHP